MKTNKLTLSPAQHNIITIQIRAEQKKNPSQYLTPCLLRDRSHRRHFTPKRTFFLIECLYINKIR
jgi:hypothetical protein